MLKKNSNSKKQKISYLILKLGDKTFSTKLFEFPKHVFDLRRNGEENNLWVKGVFTETKNHVPLSEPIDFEINIYTLEKLEESQKTL